MNGDENKTPEHHVENLIQAIEKKVDETIISKRDKIEIWLKVITLLFTIVAVIITYENYNATQKWKTVEFMSSKISEYSQNKSVKIVNQFLDYNKSKLAVDSSKYILVTDALLYEALVIDSIRGDFSESEFMIRNIFDEYLEKQSELNRYINAKAFTIENLKPTLYYQIRIISDTTNHKKSLELKHRIWDYINFYGFSDVNELYKKFGYDISK